MIPLEKALTGKSAIPGISDENHGAAASLSVNSLEYAGAAPHENIAPAIHERKGHTPGEWSAEAANDGTFCIYARSRENGTQLLGEFYAEDMGDELPVHANMTIAAAAPELLQALKALLSELEHKGSDGWMTGNVHGDDYDRARAAITKAEG